VQDRVATELIPMDEWVQELRVAQKEARKLILANIKSEQQDQVESMPHWPRKWKAGNQVMLWADCRGKGQSKKLSKKWTGPYTIIEVRSPQVVVLEEPNSRNWLTINIKQIKLFNAVNPTTLNSSLNDGHYKVEEVLEEHTTDTGRHDWSCHLWLESPECGDWNSVGKPQLSPPPTSPSAVLGAPHSVRGC